MGKQAAMVKARSSGRYLIKREWLDESSVMDYTGQRHCTPGMQTAGV